jgi:hypothetical protein
VEISVKNKILSVKHKLSRNELYKISKKSSMQSVTIYKKPTVCNGYSSKTQDNYHILMLDWDNVAYEVVQDDIKMIIDKFLLPSVYIFSTNQYEKHKTIFGSYHAVVLGKFTASEIMEIMSYTNIDENFKTSPLRNVYRSWVLRLSKKGKRNIPKFKEIIKGCDDEIEISSAHKTLLSKFYKKIKHPQYKQEDNLKIIKLDSYETLK